MKKKALLLLLGSMLLLSACGGKSGGNKSNCGPTCPVGLKEKGDAPLNPQVESVYRE